MWGWSKYVPQKTMWMYMIKLTTLSNVGLVILAFNLLVFIGISLAEPAPNTKLVTVVNKFPIEHILSTGQSNSVGQGSGTDVLSSRVLYETAYGLQLHMPHIISPLIEPNSGIKLTRGETHQSGMVNTIEYLKQLRGDKGVNIFTSSHGLAGIAFSGIAPGTVSYRDLIAAVTYAKSYADTVGTTYSVPAVVFIHGEADAALDTGYAYQHMLETMQSSLDKDIKAITGQSTIVRLFVQQMVGDNSPSLKIPIQSRMKISTAQIKAMIANPDKIIVTSPSYFLPTAVESRGGAIHTSAKGYRWMGEYIGKAIDQTLHAGTPFYPLMPTSAKIIGKSVVIDFNSPVGALQWDGNSNVKNRGFSFVGTSPLTVNSVELTGPTQVTLTSKHPLPNGVIVSYAGPSTYGPAYPKGGGALIDSDATKSLYNNDLHNHCLRFNIQIKDGVMKYI
jgi:hypothetical protein